MSASAYWASCSGAWAWAAPIHSTAPRKTAKVLVMAHLANGFSGEDYTLLVADVRESTGIKFVSDHEPVTLRGDVKRQLPVRQDVGAGNERHLLDGLVRRFAHLDRVRRGLELVVAQ